jgi:hypothetical protein
MLSAVAKKGKSQTVVNRSHQVIIKSAYTMLQIVTGRFFGQGQINQREFDAIFYSNFRSNEPVCSLAGVLRPVYPMSASVSSFVLRYTVRYEMFEGDTIYLPVGDQVVNHYRLLVGFWARKFFHVDRIYVEALCRSTATGYPEAPAHYVEHFFDVGESSFEPHDMDFAKFISKVVSMPRKSYVSLLSCLAAFSNALEAIATNRDLAYSIFVYALEALTQGADGFVPTWQDYPQDTRTRLDEEFQSLEDSSRDSIRTILLDGQHLKLMKRFVDFISSNTTDSFFTSEAEGRLSALRKNDLRQALVNLYNSRSGYVHSLKEIPQHLRIPLWTRGSDVFYWDNNPHLTFSGLVRLCHHVLTQFVVRQQVLEREDYPKWRLELDGVIEGELEPYMWLHQADGLTSEVANKWFSGFLHYITEAIKRQPLHIPDLRQTLAKLAALTPNAKKEVQRVMVCFHYLANTLLRNEFQTTDFQTFALRYKWALSECSIPAMVFSTIHLQSFSFDINECETEFELYLKRKYNRNAISLPVILEIAISANIANAHRSLGNVKEFESWLERATLDAAGYADLQTYLNSCLESQEAASIRQILNVPDSIQCPEDQKNAEEIKSTNSADEFAESRCNKFGDECASMQETETLTPKSTEDAGTDDQS